MKAKVFVIIPAFHRPEFLTRALASLRDQGPALGGVIIVNNSCDAETVRVAAAAPVPVQVVDRGCNLGTAGGIGAGMHAMLEHPAATHAWVLDDDACATPGALDAMLEAMELAGADAAAPLITDETGVVRWFPGPLQGRAWDVIRQAPTPAQFLQECGAAPVRWNWAIWASVLISRRAIEAIGFPRIDLWYQYTDLEYTLRLTARFRGVLAPKAVCPHLPPPESLEQRRKKDYWGLQNGDYVNVWLPHGWRSLRHFPGNHYRYLQRHGWNLATWRETLTALFRGAVLRQTAGPAAFAEQSARAMAAFPEWNRRPG